MELDELQKIVGWLATGGAEMMVECPAPDEPWDLTQDPYRLLFLFLLAAEGTGEASTFDVVRAMGDQKMVQDSDRWGERVVQAVREAARDAGAVE